ncbi:hypothetical protein V6N13_063805 [Hibiscus sabdariffa]
MWWLSIGHGHCGVKMKASGWMLSVTMSGGDDHSRSTGGDIDKLLNVDIHQCSGNERLPTSKSPMGT